MSRSRPPQIVNNIARWESEQEGEVERAMLNGCVTPKQIQKFLGWDSFPLDKIQTKVSNMRRRIEDGSQRKLEQFNFIKLI